jgi:hypothetical protein
MRGWIDDVMVQEGSTNVTGHGIAIRARRHR